MPTRELRAASVGKTYQECIATCERTFPQPPAQTAILSIGPLWGWSDDIVRITGINLFNQLSVTVDSRIAPVISTNAAVLSRAWDIVDFKIPLLTSNVLGPISFPAVVTTGSKVF